MPTEIYNEGRVVGYSAYEIYVKQHLSEDPDTPVASEREWLASSIAMGSSMLMKVPNMELADEETHGYIDIPLPQTSVLAAANTIIASFFDGDASFADVTCQGTSNTSGGGWAIKITDYGEMISNTDTSSPQGTVSASQSSRIPQKSLEDWNLAKKNRLKDYMKIVDGIVLQPGSWSNNSSKPPTKDFSADIKRDAYPTIRLHVKGSITNSPLVLFTGFTIRSVLLGTVGTSTAVNTASPQNGDFLGPATFPWANKIIFSVPTSYIVYFARGGYKRRIMPLDPPGLPGDPDRIRVSDSPIIDMKSGSGDQILASPVLDSYYNTSLSTDAKFYEDGSSDGLTVKRRSRIPESVSDFSTLGDGTAVLTVYSKKAIYPPALYGTFVNNRAAEFLHPIDVVAPGTVKMFYNDDGTAMQDYQDTFEGTTSINKTPDGTLEVLDPSSTLGDIKKVPTGNLTLQNIQYTAPARAAATSATSVVAPGSNVAKRTFIQTGKKQSLAVSLDKVPVTSASGSEFEGQQIAISQKPSSGITLDKSNSNDFVTWSALLAALANDQGLDILAERLRSAKNSLIENNPASGTKNGPYLEFGPNSDPIRLYICKNEPETSDVPIGSIGIGWGFNYEG